MINMFRFKFSNSVAFNIMKNVMKVNKNNIYTMNKFFSEGEGNFKTQNIQKSQNTKKIYRKQFDNKSTGEKINTKEDSFSSFDKNLQEGLTDYLQQMSSFNADFSKINPITEHNQDEEKEEEIIRKLAIKLNSQKVREKGSNYLINSLIDIYKIITGTTRSPQSENNVPYDNYFEQINTKIDKKIKSRIKQVFSRNEIIDSINLIIKHLNDLKSSEIEKIINILIKINYSNFENWKKILRQYIMYISLLDTSYQPLRSKDVVQILNHLKNMYDFLPYTSDAEIQTLLERAIKDSITYTLKNLENLEVRQMTSTITSMSKMGFLDEEVCKKIESFLITLLKKDQLVDEEFVNILFCINKSKSASEKLMNVLETHSENIIDYYLKNNEKINPFTVTLMAKSFYYGFRKESKNLTLFKKIEDLFLKNTDKFQIHQTVITAHSLVYLDKPSEEFLKKIDEILLNYKNLNNLTEFLTFQILNIIMKKKEFCLENVVKYVNLYKSFIERNQVKQKQINTLKVLVNMKIKKVKDSEELLNFLNQTKKEFSEYDLSSFRI